MEGRKLRKRPKGRKYRNLTARNQVIWLEKVIRGRRIRRSCKTSDWEMAAAVRDEVERQLDGSKLPSFDLPTFAECADTTLARMSHLAQCSQDDRHALLRAASSEREAGKLRAYFGEMRIDEIRTPILLDWWHSEIIGRGLKPKTGRAYLDTISAVLGDAVDIELLDSNPVDHFRAVLRRRSRTQKGRSQSDPGASIAPIEDPVAVDAFVNASRSIGGPDHILDLLQLDAGLRLGEATALCWQDCHFGEDGSDESRSFRIRRSNSRGKHLGPTKSGRERTVAMSRRLRNALLAHHLEQGRPTSGTIAPLDHANYRNRHFRMVRKAIAIENQKESVPSNVSLDAVTPKDLRDTFASQLLSVGIQLPYVSKQLGHADVGVTAKHYARWTGGNTYRSPLNVAEGEVPADLLARLQIPSPQSHHNVESG